MAQMTEHEIKEIVAKVIGAMQSAPEAKKSWDATQYGGRKFIGVYEDMKSAIDAANKGYKAVRAMSVEERERMGEYIMLRLRLTDGIDGREFTRRFGFSFETLYGEKCKRFVRGGFMTMSNGKYALTPAGMFISNYIISDILEFEDFGRYYFGG